ncbi:MAG: MBL fold metallo-hydrolase [Planctomycetaceae bacterium]
MRVLFVDVGQGTCQVILTGRRRAIVIDTGSHPRTVMRVLRLFRVETIELLCISHNDEDHAGGTAKSSSRKNSKWKKPPSLVMGILAHYQDAIETIAFVPDTKFAKSRFGKFLVQLEDEGKIRPEQLVTIEVQATPKLLWESENKVTQLAVISPLGGNTASALVKKNANASSAILELRHRGQKIVFAADSEYSQWRDVLRLRSNRPVDCRAITIPHHGGLMSGTLADLRWFAGSAIKADIAIVSVGTRNGYGHPGPETIKAFALSTSQVCCTQITEKCCGDLESVRPSIVGVPRFPCRSSTDKDVKRKKRNDGSTVIRSNNVGCATTISAILTDSGIDFERLDEHRRGVDKLVSNGHTPLCR